MDSVAPQRLPSLDQVADRSAEYEDRYELLTSDGACSREAELLAAEIQAWLRVCLAHGRYVAPGTADRRALKGIVDGWRSLLRRHGHHVDISDELLPFDPRAGTPLEISCPYPGLEPYTQDRAANFFGRESLVGTCVERIENPSRRVVLLIGASGSGKSSVALAGVLPALQAKHRDTWAFAKWMTPGVDPLAAMATAIVGCDDTARSGALARALAAHPDQAPRICAEATRGRPQFMIVDQLEELFTLSRVSGWRKTFADCLCALGAREAADGEFRCHMLFMLRTDQLANFEHDEDLATLHRLLIGGDNYLTLAAVDQKDIYQAIAKPAAEVGLRFVPPTLIASLTAQTAGLPNGLPLLQFALRRLWDMRPKDGQGRPLDMITEEMVEALPDVKGALGQVADGIFDSFEEAPDGTRKRICERMLLELVVLDETYEEPLRRRRVEAELVAVLRDRFPQQESAIEEVLERFVTAHLIRRFGDPAEPRLEVAHEALLRHWPYISRKLLGGEVKEKLHLIKLIGQDAADWARRDKARSLLNLRGERLERAAELAADGWLADAESKEYVARCQELAAKRKQDALAAEQFRVDKLEAERREAVVRADRIKMLAGASLAVLVTIAVAVLGGLQIWQQRRDAAANMTAFASMANSLPASEALDLAYTLVRAGTDEAALPLAHALERMAHTWQLGSTRETPVFLNGDASVAYVREYPQEENDPDAMLQAAGRQPPVAIHFYPIDVDFERPMRRASLTGESLPNELSRLSGVSIGPASDRGRHLVLLFFKSPTSDNAESTSSVLAYQIDRSQASITKLDLVADADVRNLMNGTDRLSRPGFSADGTRAVLSVVEGAGTSYGASVTSRIIELSSDEGTSLNAQLIADAVHGGAAVVAVAYRRATPGTLVTLRADGRLYCGGDHVSGTGRADPGITASGKLVTDARTSIVGVQDDDRGEIWYADCDDRGMGAQQLRGNFPRPGSLALTVLAEDVFARLRAGRSMTAPERQVILSYLEGDAMFCRRVDANRNDWHDCSPNHRIAAGVLTADGFQILSESSEQALLHRIPSKGSFTAENAGFVRGQASSAGGLLRVWPEGLPDGSRARLEWSHGERLRFSDAGRGRLVAAALSPSGSQIAWIDGKEGDYSVHSCVDQGDGEARCKEYRKTISYPRAVSIDDTGGIAIFGHEGTEGSDTRGILQFANGLRAAWDGRFGGSNPVRCFRYSPNGKWLVLGHQRGLTRTRVASGNELPAPDHLIEARYGPDSDEGGSSLASCDIDDSGRVLAGFQDGNVVLYEGGSPHGPATLLTRRVFHALPAGVHALSFRQSMGRHFAVALGQTQRTGCTRVGLPGQGIRIWDLDRPTLQREIPVSNTCLPNREIVAIGGLETTETSRTVVTLFDPVGQPTLHRCPGCLGPTGDTKGTLRKRLLDQAREKQAEVLDAKQLRDRYGLTAFGD